MIIMSLNFRIDFFYLEQSYGFCMRVEKSKKIYHFKRRILNEKICIIISTVICILSWYYGSVVIH